MATAASPSPSPSRSAAVAGADGIAAAGPQTAHILKAAQRTITALTEELVQLRQENAELRRDLAATERVARLRSVAAADAGRRRQQRRSRTSGCRDGDDSGGGGSGGSDRGVAAASFPSPAMTPREGATPVVAHAARILRMTPPPMLELRSLRRDCDAPAESTIAMSGDEAEESARATSAGDGAAGRRRAAARARLRHGTSSPTAPSCGRPSSELRDRPPPTASSDAASSKLSRYVAELRDALQKMTEHAAKKGARARRLEGELQELLSVRASDLAERRRLEQLLQSARVSEEGARKAAARAAKELAQAKQDCDAVRTLAASTIEDLAAQLGRATSAVAAGD